MFEINAMSRSPVYEQLIEQVERYILLGLLREGDQLPSVRALSGELSINPNTIQKAYGELDHGDQLFFADRYDQITGELEYLKTEITKNGEGYLSVGVYDTKKGCFDDYLMDIAITEVTGKLVLSEE